MCYANEEIQFTHSRAWDACNQPVHVCMLDVKQIPVYVMINNYFTLFTTLFLGGMIPRGGGGGGVAALIKADAKTKSHHCAYQYLELCHSTVPVGCGTALIIVRCIIHCTCVHYTACIKLLPVQSGLYIVALTHCIYTSHASFCRCTETCLILGHCVSSTRAISLSFS